jgi:hypothetical protein
MADILATLLKDGYSKQQIADYYAGQAKLDPSLVNTLRTEGYSEDQIISYAMGGGASSAFGKQFVEGVSSSASGIRQLASKVGIGTYDTEQALAERQAADIASANNPYAGFAGSLAGNIVDPIQLPLFAVAPLRGASVVGTLARQGAAQGAFGGFLEPILTPEDSRFKNTALGTVFGTAIGAGGGALVNKLMRGKTDVSPEVDAKASSDAAITDVARAIDEPLNNERMFRDAQYDYKPMSLDEKILVDQRIASLEREVGALELSKATTPDVTSAERQVASLLQGDTRAPTQAADNLPSTMTGLVSPTKAQPTRQTASLFQGDKKVVDIKEAPEVASLFKGYSLDADIKAKQTQIESLRAKLVQDQEIKLRQVTGKLPEPLVQVETKTAARFNEQPVVTREGQVPQAALSPPPRAGVVSTQQVTPEVQAALERNGFRTMEEANAALGKAPADPLNRAAMPGSVGSMRTDPYLRLANDVPFETNPEKVFDPAYRGRIDADPVSVDKTINDMHMKAVAAAGRAGRELRGKGKMGGSLEATVTLGEKEAARMTAEEGSVIDWALQNADSSWNREQIAAFMPAYKEAQAFVAAQIGEYNRLRREGLLTPELEQTIMHRAQVPLGITTIFQGQRTKASTQLNAFKTAYNEISAGKKVNGYLTPGRSC